MQEPSLSHKCLLDRKSTRLNSSHTEIYTLSLHDALPISILPSLAFVAANWRSVSCAAPDAADAGAIIEPQVPSRSEEHTSELQSHRDLHSFPTRRSSDLDTTQFSLCRGKLAKCQLRRSGRSRCRSHH